MLCGSAALPTYPLHRGPAPDAQEYTGYAPSSSRRVDAETSISDPRARRNETVSSPRRAER